MTPRVVVVGLGPGDPGLVTTAAAAALAGAPRRFVRTSRHPSAGLAGDATSFDHLYEAAERIDDVYPAIVEALVAAAVEAGEVAYAVPGSPLVAERTVELLRADARVDVEVHVALSFADLAWAAVGVDPVAAGVRLVDGHRFARDAAGERGPLLVAQVDSVEVLSDVKLSVEDPPAGPVAVLQRLGLPDQAVFTVAWDDLDRVVQPDHLTALWIPALAPPVGAELVAFSELVRTLRQGCPWDRAQTHASLRRHLLEESYEVLEALDDLDEEAGEGYEALEEELGDLLFQVVFHATIAAEAGQFTLADVARTVHGKLVHRHPHVFAPAAEGTPSAEEVLAGWERRKLVEKGRRSVLDGIPRDLPALAAALKVQRKAVGAGADRPAMEEARARLTAGLDRLAAGDGVGGPSTEVLLGDVLFAMVDMARLLELDPEGALRGATGTFRRDFTEWEAAGGSTRAD